MENIEQLNKVKQILEIYNIQLKDNYQTIDLETSYGWCIYAHINKLDGKVYIGQTNNLKERWRTHGKQGRYNGCPKIHNAINKHSWNNFYHIILEINLNQDLANEHEQEWIKIFDSFHNPNNGYNLTPGGENYMFQLW